MQWFTNVVRKENIAVRAYKLHKGNPDSKVSDIIKADKQHDIKRYKLDEIHVRIQ